VSTACDKLEYGLFPKGFCFGSEKIRVGWPRFFAAAWRRRSFANEKIPTATGEEAPINMAPTGRLL
jgi:hypothetical protein